LVYQDQFRQDLTNQIEQFRPGEVWAGSSNSVTTFHTGWNNSWPKRANLASAQRVSIVYLDESTSVVLVGLTAARNMAE